MSIIIFIIILLVLVIVHEFGHFYSAKKFGIRVDEFGFGFPPKLFGIKKGETEYTFNLLPIGGFVKIFGENPDEENTNGPDSSRSFVNKPKWQQAIVLFAGVFMNFILAWILFSIGFMTGFPTSVGSEPSGYKLSDVNLVIVSVLPKSPAEQAGLKTGDKIIYFSNPVENFVFKGSQKDYVNPENLKAVVERSKNVEIQYQRGKEKDSHYVTLAPIDHKIGISMDQIGIAKLPFFTALYKGMGFSFYMLKTTALGLYGLLSDAVRGNGSFAGVTGPVGMVGIVGDAYQFGFVYLLSFAGLISINLAIINLLPFPALDGGRLLFLLIEKVKGSRMNQKFVNYANMFGFAILILLMLVVTYKDIVKLF